MDHLSRSTRNAFAGLDLDKSSLRRTDTQWVTERLTDRQTRFVPVWRTKNLFAERATATPVWLTRDAVAEFLDTETLALLGTRGGHTLFVIGLPAHDDGISERFAAHGRFGDLRHLSPVLDAGDAAVLAYSRALAYWHQQHQFCGRCGHPTRAIEAGHARICAAPDCATQHHPRTDPAIIVLVEHTERCLLARQAIWPPGMYSTVAGFVEPGESLEAAVLREVREETDIEVAEVHYHSSQPWPFPGSIMLGFYARASSDRIRRNDQELEDARWLTRLQLAEELDAGTVQIPPQMSIAYRLIEHWYDEHADTKLSDVISRLAGRGLVDPKKIRTE